MRLNDKVRTLFDGKNFAVLSTLEPDGTPQSTVVWANRDGDHILFALPKSRRTTANLNRDPHPTEATWFFDAANPYESAQVPRHRVPPPPGERHADRRAVAQIHGGAVSPVRPAEPAMGNRGDHRRQAGHHHLTQLINLGSPEQRGPGSMSGQPIRGPERRRGAGRRSQLIRRSARNGRPPTCVPCGAAMPVRCGRPSPVGLVARSYRARDRRIFLSPPVRQPVSDASPVAVGSSAQSRPPRRLPPRQPHRRCEPERSLGGAPAPARL